VQSRPVGLGAVCASCSDRRLAHLRFFELHGMWVVLCHNCTARAHKLAPLPRSMDGLLAWLGRDRRHDDRREAPPEKAGWYEAVERRRRDRRRGERDVVDGTDLIIELEADPAWPSEDDDSDEGSITGVHFKIDAAEL
jgi:hypothetical protein